MHARFPPRSSIPDLCSSLLYAMPQSDRAIRRKAVVKRSFDLLVASCALLVLAVLMLLVAALVKVTSRGPVFYRARRAGRDGRPFSMLKFRTMRDELEGHGNRITEPEDPRVTRLGALLRCSKLDELPQLLNVLRGDMSIVGPRPEDFDLVEAHYTPLLRRSLEVRPGLACTAEVRWYPDLNWHDPPPPGVSLQDHYVARHLPAQALEGVHYVDHHGFWSDLGVIFRTVYLILRHLRTPPPPTPLTSMDLPPSALDTPPDHRRVG